MEEETPSPEYVKGFNEGYTIAKELPDLADKISAVKGDGPRLQGFQDGRKQFALDMARDLRPEWLTKRPDRNLPNTKTRDKDHGLDR